MLSNTIVLVGYLAALATIWAAVVWMRPAIARARVEREVLLVRDRVMDGILSGSIEPSNQRAQDAIQFCDALAARSREMTLPALLDTARGLKNAGIDFVEEAKLRRKEAIANSAGHATKPGELLLEHAEADLDNIVAFYLPRSTALWWFYVAAERLRRRHPSDYLAKVLMPEELARDFRESARESARGKTTPGALWIAHGNGSNPRTRLAV